jgi:hypothetical protein
MGTGKVAGKSHQGRRRPVRRLRPPSPVANPPAGSSSFLPSLSRSHTHLSLISTLVSLSNRVEEKKKKKKKAKINRYRSGKKKEKERSGRKENKEGSKEENQQWVRDPMHDIEKKKRIIQFFLYIYH